MMVNTSLYLVSVDHLDLALVTVLPSNTSHPEPPRLRSVSQLDEGCHLRLADHLQELHVEAEEELHSLRGHRGRSDGKAILLTVCEAKCVVNLQT